MNSAPWSLRAPFEARYAPRQDFDPFVFLTRTCAPGDVCQNEPMRSSDAS